MAASDLNKELFNDKMLALERAYELDLLTWSEFKEKSALARSQCMPGAVVTGSSGQPADPHPMVTAVSGLFDVIGTVVDAVSDTGVLEATQKVAETFISESSVTDRVVDAYRPVVQSRRERQQPPQSTAL
eukprot:Hpha_TRINITY_DN36547_c0_g1::TRINITY_DN36547_c0_g1_i1::g.130757::m.130757